MSLVIKNKEPTDIRIDFRDVNYTSLPNGLKNGTECKRKISIESVHELRALKPTNYLETLTHLLKGNIGCGILGLGLAFKNGGLLLSVVLIFIFSLVSCYNQHMLISMANQYKRKYNRSSISFGDTIGTAFENGPPIFKRLSLFIRKFINFTIIVTQLGACCVYVLFISQSLQQLLECYNIKVNIHILMITVLPIIWMTALIREIKYIVPLSTFANFATVAALSLILHNSLSNLEPISSRKLIGRLEDLPLCLGTMVFSIEGISLILPLEQNMKKNERFVGTFGVLNISIAIIAILLNVVGVFGYWKFGDDVQGTLTMNLNAKESVLARGVIFALMLGILCSYALQFFIPILLIMPKINYYVAKWPYSNYHIYEYLLRSTLVLLTTLIAEVIPHFDLFTSFIGAVGGTFLAFIFCPIADLVARQKSDYGKCNWRLILTVFSLIVGFSTLVLGTVVSSKEIYLAIKKDLHM